MWDSLSGSKVCVFVLLATRYLTTVHADFVGCYSGLSDLLRVNSPSLTQYGCILYCVNHNYLYAGLSYRYNALLGYYTPFCSCADSLFGAVRESDDNCRVACPKDRTQSCGGYGLDLVFYIDSLFGFTTMGTATKYETIATSTASTTEYQTTLTSAVSSTSAFNPTPTTYKEHTTAEEMVMTETVETQRGREIWYICVSILVIFIGSISIVIWAINKDGRRRKSRRKELVSLPNATDNIYCDSTEIDETDYAEVPETKDSDQHDIYTEVSEVRNLQNTQAVIATEANSHAPSGVMYHTVHRPESADDEVTPLSPKYAVVNKKHSPESDRPTGVNNEQPPGTIRPSHYSSVGSVDNIIYESRGSLYTHEEEDVFLPLAPTAGSSGTIINVIYERASIRKKTGTTESLVDNEH